MKDQNEMVVFNSIFQAITTNACNWVSSTINLTLRLPYDYDCAYLQLNSTLGDSCTEAEPFNCTAEINSLLSHIRLYNLAINSAEKFRNQL